MAPCEKRVLIFSVSIESDITRAGKENFYSANMLTSQSEHFATPISSIEIRLWAAYKVINDNQNKINFYSGVFSRPVVMRVVDVTPKNAALMNQFSLCYDRAITDWAENRSSRFE